jgi:hypothetical protein
MLRQGILIACMLIGLGWPGGPAAAIVNGVEPDLEDHRFDAIGAFSRTAWLQIGGGDEPDHQHNWFGAATLIAPNKIITARHLLPAKGMPRPAQFIVRFRRHLDGTLGSIEAGPQSYHQVRIIGWLVAREVDLAIGILEDPVEHIEPIRLSTGPMDFHEQPGYLAGWGSHSPWISMSWPRKRLMVGENKLTLLIAANIVVVSDWSTETRNWRKDKETGKWITKPHVTTEAAVPNMYDSGGAMLLEDEKKRLHLVGVITTYKTGVWVSDDAQRQTWFTPPHERATKNTGQLTAP